MKKINKSTEPTALRIFREKEKHGNDWSLMRDKRYHSVYEDCILQALEDQHDLCGYTEVKISSDNYHIDHFVKRNLDPTLTYEWDNMIAAVHHSRFGADYKDSLPEKSLNFDATRHQYKYILNPVTDDCATRFRYSTDGKIEAIDPSDQKANETIRVFNLQENSLNQRRKQLMEVIRKLLQSLSKEEVSMYFQNEEFQSVIEFELSQNR